MRVEHYARTAETWRSTVLTAADEVLELDAVDFRIDLARVYFDLGF
jgi:hypothetical protein